MTLRRVAATLLSSVFLFCSAAAQTAAPTSTSRAPEQTDEQRGDERMLGVVPRFKIVEGENAPPLTIGQKFKLFRKIALDPSSFATSAFQAGIEQATDSFHDYGQGAAGYGKRFGASFADGTSSAFFKDFFYPSLFKQDPRYFRLGTGTATHRVRYALLQEFVSHTDSGGKAFNYSKVLGAFSAGALANTYYPKSDRGVGLTMSRAALSVAYGSAAHLIDEFWPDIHRKFFKKSHRP